MSRIRGAFVLTAIALCVAPAAGASNAAVAETPALPAGWLPASHDAFSALLDARGTRIPAAEAGDLQRDLLSLSGAAIADPEFVFPARAGDLDGDGAGDVLTFEFAGSAAQLVARRGSTGDELWSMPGAYSAIPTDLDGDAASDTIVLASGPIGILPPLPGQPDPVPPVSLSANPQTVSLVHGDGHLAWSYTVPGVVQRLGDPTGSLASDVDAVVALNVMRDATGDGVLDVWVGTTTFTQYAFDTMVQANVFVGRTIDGATGLEVGRVVAVAVDGMPWIVPASDVSGDGLADVFSFTAGRDGDGILAATSVTGIPRWAQAIPTRFAYPTVLELTGDGVSDVMLQAFSDGGAQRLAYSGIDGVTLWARPDNGYTDRAGDIDGDGGTDLIQIEGMFGSAITATAWSGKTGMDLWGPTSYPAPEGAMTVHCICTDDLTGDGVWDPLTAELLFSDPMEMTVRALDGSTGTPLWVSAWDPGHGFPIPLGADADGDGADDLGVAYGVGSDLVLETMRGADSAPIWTASAAIDGFSIGFYGDDVTGDGDPEVVLASLRFVEESISGAAHAIDRVGHLWSTHETGRFTSEAMRPGRTPGRER